MTDTQGLTSPIDIPCGAVDAAARALGNHIELDFDVLPADEQLQAREVATAALNAAAPLIVAAELERLAESIDVTAPLGDLIATAEAAARCEVARSLIARAAELKAGVDEPAKPEFVPCGAPHPDHDWCRCNHPSGFGHDGDHRGGGHVWPLATTATEAGV